ncbi:MAG: DNA-directed RNA polymerase subunit H [Candidatus Nanohalarchaeota archaeon]|nr:MAG: DNA-directed RNA polymerase subunit H [Candidatus Nanohaloarchaeota archaeon]
MSEKDIFTHELVPEHKILMKSESQKILKELDITADQLPKILDTDPIAEIIGAKTGDIIEITRDSPTAGKTKYYRIVIPE